MLMALSVEASMVVSMDVRTEVCVEASGHVYVYVAVGMSMYMSMYWSEIMHMPIQSQTKHMQMPMSRMGISRTRNKAPTQSQ